MNFLIKLRLQFNDFFSSFTRFIAPTYYHDRCERTLQMYVYIMHKREVLLSLLALLSAYILLLFIGLAGPNVDKVNAIRASEIFRQDSINASLTHGLLESGPFQITTPSLSSYSQQLSLWVAFSLQNEESSEAFHKQFQVQIQMFGLDGGGGTAATVANGTANLPLYCGGRRCDPIRVLKLASIGFEHYTVRISFDHLQSVNEKYIIEDILFEFRSINVSYTNLAIWFRFFFILITLLVMCCFMHNLYRFPVIDWSLEQKWTTVQLILLILSNNPFYPLQFLLQSATPRILEISLHTSLQCLVMLFWLCFFHGIRQSNRSVARFYAPKLAIVGTIWASVTYTMSWSLRNQLENPIFDEQSAFRQSALLQLLMLAFYLAYMSYFVYLGLLILAAFTELRSMPYFDVRLKLQTFLMLFVMTISMLTILLSGSSSSASSSSSSSSSGASEGGGGGESGSVGTNGASTMISEIAFLRLLPFTHFSSSSATFLSIFSLANIYVCACAYYYRPSLNQHNECQVMRDNPALSMINDSDEEILYGSDTEELLELVDAERARGSFGIRGQNHYKPTPLSSTSSLEAEVDSPAPRTAMLIPNLMDTRTDEESD